MVFNFIIIGKQEIIVVINKIKLGFGRETYKKGGQEKYVCRNV